MTQRLYYQDSYLTRFTAHVTKRSADGREILLDRTAFYPTSGGQPHDLGTLAGLPLIDVRDEEPGIVHVLHQPLTAADEEVTGEIDWARRYDLMQQHTGQHLLSAVCEERFQWKTVSVAFNDQIATVELATPAISDSHLDAIEERANELCWANRPVNVSFEDASEASGLRKESAREGTLRIVTIEGVDRSACGGTHVCSTAELGPILLRRTEKVRGNTRLEFLCGARAIRAARRDFLALNSLSRQLTVGMDQVPTVVEQQSEKLKSAVKTLQRVEGELAAFQAAQQFDATRSLIEQADGELPASWTHFANYAANHSGLAFLGTSTVPPSIILAASPDRGLHAGNVLKEMLAKAGGRGGGSATVARGTVPSLEALAFLRDELSALLAGH